MNMRVDDKTLQQQLDEQLRAHEAEANLHCQLVAQTRRELAALWDKLHTVQALDRN